MRRLIPYATAVLGITIGAVAGVKTGQQRSLETLRVLDFIRRRGPVCALDVAVATALRQERVAGILYVLEFEHRTVESRGTGSGRLYSEAKALTDKVVADA